MKGQKVTAAIKIDAESTKSKYKTSCMPLHVLILVYGDKVTTLEIIA